MTITTYMDTQDQGRTIPPMTSEQDIATIIFAKGLPGFAGHKTYKLLDLDDGALPPLKLLVSIDNPAISFLLYPHTNETALYNHDQKQAMADGMNVDLETLEIYSIVTIRQPQGALSLTTNLQSPILIHRDSSHACQYAHSHKTLDANHPLKRYYPAD